MSDLQKVVTPQGMLMYVNISGQGKQNYNQDGYNYVATNFLSGQAAEDMKAKIDAVLGEVPKGKNVKSKGYRQVYKDSDGKYFVETTNRKADLDNGDEETEYTAFGFVTATTWKDGNPKKIKVYNAKAQPVDLGEKRVGNGTIGSISGNMQRFDRGRDVGVSLFLNAIQISKFVEYEGDDGFEATEDGDFVGVDEDTGFEMGETNEGEDKPKPKL